MDTSATILLILTVTKELFSCHSVKLSITFYAPEHLCRLHRMGGLNLASAGAFPNLQFIFSDTREAFASIHHDLSERNSESNNFKLYNASKKKKPLLLM